MDEYLDQFMEDHINAGYGHILDQLAAEECHTEPPCFDCDGNEYCQCWEAADDVLLDGDHESTMTSIGWGTDEDYGFFGDDASDF